MSAYDGYDEEPRRYRSVRTRQRDRDDPDFMREETYIERGKGAGPRGAELVYRGRDDSVEDIRRDFPPPGRDDRRSGLRTQDDYAPSRRARSSIGGRSRYDDDYSYYEDDRSTDYTATGAGRSTASRYSRRRRDRDYDSEYSQSPPPRERRKSGVGEFLEGLGLGGVVGAVTGKKDHDRSESRGAGTARSRSRARSRRYSSDEDTRRSRSRRGDRDKTERKWAQAAQAALVAGAVEAFRSRNEPGPWNGEKGKRIATAALGAGGIDGLIDRDPDKKTKRHLAEAVIGGLAANRLANGPRSKSRGPRDRDGSPDSRAPRSRSRSIIDRFRGRSKSRGRGVSEDKRDQSAGGGALKGLAAGGAIAAAGKAIYDRVRSKSRRRRSPSSSSADSYVPSRNRRRDQRRSPPSGAEATRRTGAVTSRGIDGNNQNSPGNGALVKAGGAGAGAGAVAEGSASTHDKDKGNESDSSSTTDMENKRKRMRGKEMITIGLASVATIHAAHGVYSSMEAHEKRHRLVAEGEMSPEEARKKQTKAWIQDAAAVGIAALGIKGAFSEWKEMSEQRREIHEIEKRKRDRRKKLERKKKQEENERHERMMKIFEQNPQLAMGYQMSQSPTPQLQMPTPTGAPAFADQSGNPYASRR